MSATTTLGRAPAGHRPGARPLVRHGFLAAALLVVAVLRATSGDWLWAGLLGLGAAAETAVLLLERRSRAGRPRPAAGPEALPSSESIELSLRGHRQAERLWGWMLAGTLLTALALVGSAPTFAMLVAATALVALVRLRRTRRTVATLRLLQDRQAGSSRSGREGATS